MAASVRAPQVGDEVICFDPEGEEYTVVIDEVGSFDPEFDSWTVTAEGDEYSIYWDNAWIATD